MSYEKDRILATLKALCERSNRGLFAWNVAAYFKVVASGEDSFEIAG